MKRQGVVMGVLMALMGFLPLSVHAAALVAGSIVGDVGSLGTVIFAVLIILGAIAVLALAIDSFVDIKRGDITDGIKGVFISVLAAVVIFVIIKGLVGGELAAAATLR